MTIAGRHTYGTNNVRVHRYETTNTNVYIGNFCSIAEDCEIFVGGGHPHWWISTWPFGHLDHGSFPNFDPKLGLEIEDASNWKNIYRSKNSKGDVVIGSDVWIGSHVTIMSGVTIGDGAVIACNSHVVRDVPPYCMAGGNPATVFKKRFSDEIIEKLLKLKWWDKSDEEINQISSILASSRFDLLFDKYEV
jgi:acetyltransferase-like isoleucine patch superfamily enzyme